MNRNVVTLHDLVSIGLGPPRMVAFALVVFMLWGCGAVYLREQGRAVYPAPASRPWVSDATDGAITFWREHGVDFDDAAPGTKIVAMQIPDDAQGPRNGLCAFGEILISAMLVQSPDLARCSIAHEMGHKLGMNHVDDPRSLMAEHMGVDEHGACFWSAADDQELDAALARHHSACPGDTTP